MRELVAALAVIALSCAPANPCACMTPDGGCHPGTSPEACGVNAGWAADQLGPGYGDFTLCMQCPAGETCRNGHCSGGCRPESCSGCCRDGSPPDTSECRSGYGKYTWGKGGMTCIQCLMGKCDAG